MNEKELKTRDKIVETLRKHYKRTNITYACVSGDYLTMIVENCASYRYPWIAKRVLDTYPEIRVVHFTGNWIEGVYTRNTLEYCGYKMKMA